MEKITPERLLGATMLCPHCNQKLRVVRVVKDFTEGTDPSGQPNRWFPIMLEDGEWARMWEKEY